MARKKKTDAEKFDEAIMKNEYYDLEPVVTVGSHLTVTKYPDGRTELKWDDEALMRDVQNAIASVENLVKVTEEKVKKTRKKKVTE
jgi:hypothetical protein